jgi:hypothetical protein
VEVDVVVVVGDRMLVTVWHRPVRGSMIAHVGESEIWANDASVPPESRRRVITSPKLAPRETCMTARLKRRPFMVPTPPESRVASGPQTPSDSSLPCPTMTKPKYSHF